MITASPSITEVAVDEIVSPTRKAPSPAPTMESGSRSGSKNDDSLIDGVSSAGAIVIILAIAVIGLAGLVGGVFLVRKMPLHRAAWYDDDEEMPSASEQQKQKENQYFHRNNPMAVNSSPKEDAEFRPSGAIRNNDL